MEVDTLTGSVSIDVKQCQTLGKIAPFEAIFHTKHSIMSQLVTFIYMNTINSLAGRSDSSDFISFSAASHENVPFIIRYQETCDAIQKG